MSDFLVIGYGNTLRHDDGAGPWVAERVGALLCAEILFFVVPQLLPELAEALAQPKYVVFVDARQDSSTVRIQLLEPNRESHPIGTHISDPATLLDLTAALFGSQPRAWLVTMPGEDFSHGEGLSIFTQQSVELAVQWIVTEYQRLHAAMPP